MMLLKNSKELHAVWINSCTKDFRRKMAVLSMYDHCLYVQSQNHEEKKYIRLTQVQHAFAIVHRTDYFL